MNSKKVYAYTPNDFGLRIAELIGYGQLNFDKIEIIPIPGELNYFIIIVQ